MTRHGAGSRLRQHALAPQDSQYWTQKYGTKGLLLSGVAISGGIDLSTTYYNLGGLATIRLIVGFTG